MSEIKTKPCDLDITKFLSSVELETNRADIIELKKMFDRAVQENASARWEIPDLLYVCPECNCERIRPPLLFDDILPEASNNPAL